MTIERFKRGSGLTETEVIDFGNPNALSTVEWDEFDARLELDTIEGRLKAIETACGRVLQDAGLPMATSSFLPWPEIEHRGYSVDSVEGFAARMLGDARVVRDALATGDLELVAMGMFYLGAKWALLRVKRHEPTFETGRKIRAAAQSGRRFDQAERVTAVDSLCAKGWKITNAFAQVATLQGVTAKAIETDYYKAKKTS